MNTGRTLFAQVIELLPRYEFQKCVTRYDGDRRVRSFSCWDHVLCLIFAQLTCRESLRDIVACLRAVDGRLYHMGIRGTVSRSTLADANELRDWRIYADFAQVLIREARQLYADAAFGVDLANTVYALDSTTIDLCMSLFPWARSTRTQHAMKLHTLLDLRGNIPTFIRISAAQLHDVNVLDNLVPEAGAFYVMDRGYLDFERLYRWTLAGAFFVTRARKNFRFDRVDIPTGRQEHRRPVRSDHPPRVVLFVPGVPRRPAADSLSRPADAQAPGVPDQQLRAAGRRIADLYRCRWQVELFFKWIKQHLRIKAFYGTSENAVKTQVWMAVCRYLLVAIARQRLKLGLNLYTMLQILSVSLFEKTPINQAFSMPKLQTGGGVDHNQLSLLDF